MKLDSQIVGNVGLYYVCYHLSWRAWNVMPTARNAKGIDVVAYSKSGYKFLGIQVMTVSRRNAVPLGKSLDKIMGDFWVIVTAPDRGPTVYVMLPDEVRGLARRGEKDGRISYWLERRSYEYEEYEEAWSRIGCGHDEL